MKRLFALLISLCLALSLAPASAQSRANHNQLLGGVSPDSLAATDDSLWALADQQLWRWQPGQSEASLAAEGFTGDMQEGLEPGILLAFAGDLYHFQQQAGLLHRLDILDSKISLHSPVAYPKDQLLGADEQPRLIKNLQLTAQGLWLLLEGTEGGSYELLLLTEGQAQTFNPKDLVSIAPYKESQLLVIQGKEGKKLGLASFNPQNQKLKVLIKSLPRGADGLCYDPEADTAYYFSGGDIMAHPNLGKGKVVAHLPALYLFRNPSLVQGHLAAALPDGLYIRSLTTSDQPKPRVRVYQMDQFTLNRVRALLPEIDIVASQDTWYTANELAQAVITGSFNYDVALLELANPQLYKLMDKGYLADLGSDPAVKQLAGRIHPVYLAPLTRDGRLFGLPESLRINTFSYDPAVLNRMGLAPSDLPQDLLSLTDFLASWKERFSQFDGEILPLSVQDRNALINTLTDLYIQEHLLRGLPLSFDTPPVPGVDGQDRRAGHRLPGQPAHPDPGKQDAPGGASVQQRPAGAVPLPERIPLQCLCGLRAPQPAAEAGPGHRASLFRNLRGGDGKRSGQGGRRPGGGRHQPVRLGADHGPHHVSGLPTPGIKQLPGKQTEHGGIREVPDRPIGQGQGG